MPRNAHSVDELELIVIALEQQENRAAALKDVALTANLDMPPPVLWVLLKTGKEGAISPDDPAMAAPLIDLTLLRKIDGSDVELTQAGHIIYDRIVAIYQDRFAKLVANWEPEHHDEARAMLNRLATSILSEPPV